MSELLDEKLVFEKIDDIVCRNNEDGSIVVLRIDSGDEFFKIEGVASEAFELIDSKRTLGEIVKMIDVAYGVGEEVICKDVSIFFSDLLAKNIVKAK